MRTKKIRLGMIVAALAVAVSGPAAGAAQSVAAEPGLAESHAVADTGATVTAPVIESASLASYDWT